MTDDGYERLSALDNFFLIFESPNTPMHVGSAAIFDAASLLKPDGGIDGRRIKAYVASRLDQIPRYRERLVWIPLAERPVWVDDDHLDLDYHIRHTSLPKPGNERQLKDLAARIISQPLDTRKPLWETWVIEGLEHDRFAMIFKVHHCMIDGISGADLLSTLLSPKPDPRLPHSSRWVPRPAPSRLALLRDQLVERLKAPVLFSSRALRHPLTVASTVARSVGAVAQTMGSTLQFVSRTPLNQPISAHRRFEWATMDIAAIKAVKDVLGGTLNDVVLATVAGAVRSFLERRQVDVAAVRFRVFVPVSLRSATEHGTLGNRVAGWFIDLPLGEPEPRTRFTKIRNAMVELKKTDPALAADALTGMAEWVNPSLFGLATRLVSGVLPFNLVVTNVPGPPMPLYLLDSRMLAVYPVVPLYVNLGLGIALFSNDGKLFWGFNADWDVVPDLDEFVACVRLAFDDLCAVARVAERGRALEIGFKETLTSPVDRSERVHSNRVRKRRKASGARYTGRRARRGVPGVGMPSDGARPQA